MRPELYEQEQKHPLPLWMRWLIVCLVLLIIIGGILWDHTRCPSDHSYCCFYCPWYPPRFLQLLPSLLPVSKHAPSTVPAHSSLSSDEQVSSAGLYKQLSPSNTPTASSMVNPAVHIPIPTTSVQSDKEGTLREDWGTIP